MEERIDYMLGTFDSPNINSVRRLTPEQYNEYTEYIGILRAYSTDQRLFRLVEMNYDDLKKRVEHYNRLYVKDEQKMDFIEIELIYLDINRLILNLLSSVRTYLDHTETRLKRKYGNLSEQYKLFQTTTATAFDNFFAYRFLYKVRNYAQHCGLPSGSVEINSSGDAEGKTVNTMNIYFVRDHLLNVYDSWGPVKDELSKMDDQFDVLPLIEEKFKLIGEINKTIATKELDEHKTAAHVLVNLIFETEATGGIPCIFKINGTRENPKLTFSWFPYDVISASTGVEINIGYMDETLNP